MKTTCPKCKTTFDIPIKTVLGWIKDNKRLNAAVTAMAAGLLRAKAKPENMSRGSDGARKAASARWEKYRNRADKS